MTEENTVYKADIPGWYFILGPISALLIGQKTKGLVGIIGSILLSWLGGLGGLVWLFFIIDAFMINKWMNEHKKPIGDWTFFFQLDK